MTTKKIKIAMAMSGGIDSSVSALLLKKQGYDVAGFFIKFWADPTCNLERENSCCDTKSLEKAKETAKKLKIPFYVIDVKKIFKKIVVDGFIDGYKNLETPNPCVVCNKFIKFGWFLDFAEKLGFEKIATGHYARIKKDKEGVWRLFSGYDKIKDQSYFLHQLNQEQLAKIIFPVGEITKKEVEKIAKSNDLNFEGRKESQEICFIKGESYREFLKRHLAEKYFKSGEIVDFENKKIGCHDGLINYTIGQRKGIKQDEIKGENKKPLYVFGLRKKGNKLIVGPEEDILSREMFLKDLTWISKMAKKKALESGNLKIKIRYRHLPASGILKKGPKNFIVKFEKPQRAITPGQYAVFYDKDEILGGGKIVI